MGFDFAEAKLAARQVVHDYLSVSAVYHDADQAATDITVRFHTKLARAGALEGGFGVEIIEGIHRLVFNGPQLEAANDGDGVVLKQGGVVTIPQYGNVQFSLEAEEEPDGPLNIYWTVAQIVPVQVVEEPPPDTAVYLTTDDGDYIVLG